MQSLHLFPLPFLLSLSICLLLLPLCLFCCLLLCNRKAKANQAKPQAFSQGDSTSKSKGQPEAFCSASLIRSCIFWGETLFCQRISVKLALQSKIKGKIREKLGPTRSRISRSALECLLIWAVFLRKPKSAKSGFRILIRCPASLALGLSLSVSVCGFVLYFSVFEIDTFLT